MKNRIQKLLAVATFVGAASASAIAAPRTLANGAPAPGNTVAKGESSYTQRFARIEKDLRAARRELVSALSEERTAALAMKAQPRTLANGAPACGNTGGKMACTTERSDEEWKARVQRLVRAGVAVRAAQARVASLKKTYAKFGSTADQTLLASTSS